MSNWTRSNVSHEQLLRLVEAGQLPPLTDADESVSLLTVYFGTPSMFITLWFGFDY
jgi:hypothetical protein